MNVKKLFTAHNLILLLVIIALTVLRFWKAPELFFFGIDEEYQSHYAATIARDFHVVWIGVSAADTGYYLGPGFTYLNALLFWFSNFDPIILPYFAAFLGVLTSLSIYIVSKVLFNKKVALIALILYGLSTLMVFYDKRFWNPSLVPILSIWLFFSLVKAQKNPLWLLLTALLMGASYHSHITMWLFWPFIFGTLFYIRKKVRPLVWLGSLVTFLIVTSPLLFYDIIHNYDNILMPIRMLTSAGEEKGLNVLSHITDLFNTLGRMWYLPPYTNVINEAVPGPTTFKSQGNIILSLATLFILIYAGIRLKTYPIRLAAGIILLFFIAYIFYPGNVHEYYLLGVFPLVIVVMANWIDTLKQPLFIAALLLVFGGLNMYSVFSADTRYGLISKRELIQKVSPFLEEKGYYLQMSGTYRSYAGWRYLFKVYGVIPGQSQTDTMFGWLYPNEITSQKPTETLTISDKELKKPKNNFKFISNGDFNALITIEDDTL